MKRTPFKRRIVNMVSAIALIIGQIILPTNAAFAQSGNSQNQAQSPYGSGANQPVWCMITGYGWTAQLGGNNSNRFPLTQIPAGADDSLYIDQASGQVYAPNSSSQALKGQLDAYCATQYTVSTPLPVAVCGPNNDVISTGAHMTILTDTGWHNNSRAIKFSATAPYTFKVNGQYVTTATITYTDANQACPETTIPVPEMPGPNDPCGLNNASWVVPADTESVHWALIGSELHAYAKTGFVFSNNTYDHNFGMAPDSGALCGATKPTVTQQVVRGPINDTAAVTGGAHFTSRTVWQNDSLIVIITADAGYAFSDGSTSYSAVLADENTPCLVAIPTTPGQNDPCGVNNASWILPADTATIHWYITGGHLHASVVGNYTFTDGKTDHDYGLAVDSGTLCKAEKPIISAVEFCGLKNDDITVSGGAHFSYTKSWQYNVLVVTVKADAGYVFSDGSSTYTVCFTDKNVPCTQDVPKMPQYTDPCDDAYKVNAPYWTVTPKDTDQYTWKLNRDRSYTVTAKPGTMLRLPNGMLVMSFTYKLPPNDRSNVCYTTIHMPKLPDIDYTCGATSSAAWTLPDRGDEESMQNSNSYQGDMNQGQSQNYHWKVIHGELWLFAKDGYAFNDHGNIITKKSFGHASHYVKYQPCVIDTPSYTSEEMCGPENDTITPEKGDNYTATVSEWQDGVKTITFKANKHFVFANEQKEFSVTYTDEAVACPVPPAPVFDDMSCTVNDTTSYTIPNSEYFYYTVQVGDGMEVAVDAGTYNLSRVNQTVTIRVYDNNAKKLAGTWSHGFIISVCNVGMGNQKPPVTQAVQELPQTGSNDNTQYSLIGFGLAALTYGAVYFAQRKHA